jgi:uncharacterized iron-regulated membrane protein
MAEDALFLVKDESTMPASPAANSRRRKTVAIGWLAMLWHHPRKTWLRRALFQVHLWSGIAVGVIATVVGVSGSAIVYKDSIDRILKPGLFSLSTGPRLSVDALLAAASSTHRGSLISYVAVGQGPKHKSNPWIFYMASPNHPDAPLKLVYIDPSSGAELGSINENGGLMNWLADLHFRLLSGSNGTLVNGIGAGLLFVLCVSGLIVWWPGKGRVRGALTIRTHARWPRLNWDIHSVFGFWCVIPLGVEAFTGAYYCFFVPMAAALVFLFGGSVHRWQEMSVPPRSNPVNAGVAVQFETLLRDSLLRHPDCILRGLALPLVSTDPFTVQLDPPYAEDRGDYVQVAYDQHRGIVLSDIDSRHESLAIRLVLFIRPLHFGTFAGQWSRIVWIVVGLLPGILFFTGFLMWWRRVPGRLLRSAVTGR